MFVILVLYKIENMNAGSKITIKHFAYTNKHGGTNTSAPLWERFRREDEEYFEEPIEVMVTKSWYDYETGTRGWALPKQSNKKLMNFLRRNCKEGHNHLVYDENGLVDLEKSQWIKTPGEFVIFWSEHDIV